MGQPTVPLQGVIAPVFTPFDDDLSIATDLFASHARTLMETGCGGLVPFGMTGEALAIKRDERVDALWALKEAGIDPARMIPGTGLCSYGETADLTRACLDLGCAGVVVLPPFCFKGVRDQGVYDWYAKVIELVGDDTRLYLCHMPQATGVDLSVQLVRRLHRDFPEQIVGIMDASDNWQNTRALLQIEDFFVYPSSETLLLESMALGALGCVTATANFNAQTMVEMLAAHEAGSQEDAALLRKTIMGIREATAQAGFIPVAKAYMALKTGDARWANMRPPHVRASDAAAYDFRKKIDAAR